MSKDGLPTGQDLRLLVVRRDVIEAVREFAGASTRQEWSDSSGAWFAEPLGIEGVKVIVGGSMAQGRWRLLVRHLPDGRSAVSGIGTVGSDHILDTELVEAGFEPEYEMVLLALARASGQVASLRAERLDRERSSLKKEAEEAGWAYDDQLYGPATPEIVALLERASRLTRREAQALERVQSETRVPSDSVWTAPLSDSPARKRQLSVINRVEAILEAAPLVVVTWAERARENAETAVGRSGSRDRDGSTYVGELARALVVSSRLSEGLLEHLFREWHEVVEAGRAGEVESPEKVAYRQAGSCFAVLGLLASAATCAILAGSWVFLTRASRSHGSRARR